MRQSAEIVIVGAGLVGLALANLLAKNDQLNILLIDVGEQADYSVENDVSLRVSAFAPGSVELLSVIGVWDQIVTQRVCPYRDMRVWDAGGHVDGPETLSFAAAEFALPQLGFIVENDLVRYVLQERLKTTAVSMQFETSINAIKLKGDRYEVELSSGVKLAPELLIGADGARSFVRESAGITVRSWQHMQNAFVTHLRPELRHQNTAWQRFAKDGPIGLLPLSDGRVSAVWSTTPETTEAALKFSDEQLALRLTDISGYVLGRLTPAGPRGAYPLTSRHAAHYVAPGLALVGDAAHAIHPLAGQGVNLGFADAAKLSEVVSQELRRGENIGDLPVLRKYERARIGSNKTMLLFVDGLNRLFKSDSARLARLRGAGMLAFNKSGPIRDFAVRVALGMR